MTVTDARRRRNAADVDAVADARRGREAALGNTRGLESMPIELACECGDPACRARISILPKAYAAIGRAGGRLVKAGHEDGDRVVANGDRFCVVQPRLVA